MLDFFKNNLFFCKVFGFYFLLVFFLPKVAELQSLLIFFGFACVYMYFNSQKINKINDLIQDKDTFVATIVHDLKNPLIGQNRLFEMLIRNAKKDGNESLIELYSHMLGSSKMMFELVMSILNTYKYENGKIEYNFQKCDLVELVKETCSDLVNYTADEKMFHYCSNIDKQYIKADKMQLKRVVSNLVSNAIRYRKEDTPIFVEINVNNDDYCFSVKNSGYYIRPELQEDIFKKFVSKNTKFNKITTGLGLYLSKEIIKAHKGKMLVNSTFDGENTFGFVLPKMNEDDLEEKIEFIS